VVYVALALAVLVVALNVSGTKMSGQIQAVIVTLVIAGLLAYVVNAGFVADTARHSPFTTHGSGGVVTAAAFVFVSYAGVTKVASVAEEVKDPGRNLPRAILGERPRVPRVRAVEDRSDRRGRDDPPAPPRGRRRRDHRDRTEVIGSGEPSGRVGSRDRVSSPG